MIEFKKVNQLYGSSQILWDLDLHIKPNSITCLMGRNGVGKTTALKVLMGLLPVKTGQVVIDGEDFSKKSTESRPYAGVGYVPQGRDIFPQLTVEENLRIGLGCRKDRSKKIPEKIYELFPVLYDMLNRRGGDLSGGQQQRVAVARAIVNNPKLILADEPTGNLDSANGDDVMKILADLNAKGTTIVMVTHSQYCAEFGNRIVRLLDGQVVTENIVRQYL